MWLVYINSRKGSKVDYAILYVNTILQQFCLVYVVIRNIIPTNLWRKQETGIGSKNTNEGESGAKRIVS